jgi:hypothetical protein
MLCSVRFVFYKWNLNTIAPVYWHTQMNIWKLGTQWKARNVPSKITQTRRCGFYAETYVYYLLLQRAAAVWKQLNDGSPFI